ncbi:hypothetical protein WJX77_006713 [Trebouxia sp. C0004]
MADKRYLQAFPGAANFFVLMMMAFFLGCGCTDNIPHMSGLQSSFLCGSDHAQGKHACFVCLIDYLVSY